MALPAHEIEELLEAAFPDATFALTDTRGDGDHYHLVITSAAFRNKTRIQQHQLVYAALGERMGRTLHALSIQTFAPPLNPMETTP